KPVLVPNVVRSADDFAAGAADMFMFAFGAPKVREVDVTVGGTRFLAIPESPGIAAARKIQPYGYFSDVEPGPIFVGVEGPMGIILAMAIYIYFSPSLPGDFQTRWVSPERLVAYLGLDVNSMIGSILQVAVLVVIPFTILGQVLARTGGADFFADISMAAMGRFRGGSAK